MEAASHSLGFGSPPSAIYYRLAFVSLLLVGILATGADAGDGWHCGSGQFSEITADLFTSTTCSARKEALNICCRDHDRCYDDQRGRVPCDDTYCNCIRLNVIDGVEEKGNPIVPSNGNMSQQGPGNAMRRKLDELALKLNASIDSLACNAADNFCNIVRDYGQEAYEEAGRAMAAKTGGAGVANTSSPTANGATRTGVAGQFLYSLAMAVVGAGAAVTAVLSG